MRVDRPRPGLSLIELLVVLGIIATLVGVMLPAVQRAREAANRARCSNHLRQIGQATLGFQGTNQGFPSNGGWDGKQFILSIDGTPLFTTTWNSDNGRLHTWGIGDATIAPHAQPGSWAFSILPFLEQDGIYRTRSWMDPVAVYACPSRRASTPQIAPAEDAYGKYGGGGWAWAKTDYAGNDEVFLPRLKVRRIEEITDGTSNTLLVGEKAMDPSLYTTGSWHFDEPFFLGGSHGTVRNGTAVCRDALDLEINVDGQVYWGSAHPSGANFLMVDGSVRVESYGTPWQLVLAMLTVNGGEAAPD